MARKQLMLKEYLELDWTAEPDGAPLGADEAAATVRCLLEEELRRGAECGRRKMLPRPRSLRALTKISAAALSAVRLLAFAAGDGSGGSRRTKPEEPSAGRSISMRFRAGRFWRTRRKQEEVTSAAPPTSSDEEKAIDEGRSSFNFPSLVASVHSSCSECDNVSISAPSSSASSSSADVGTSGSAAAGAGDAKEEDIPTTPSNVGEDAGAGAAVDRTEESPVPECQSSEEESEQLSPVSVMDFPSEAEDDEEEEEEDEEEEEEEGEENSSAASFDQSLAKLERTKLQLLQKIRRFECLADLDPVDLDRRFASSSEDEDDEEEEITKARGLLGELKAASGRRVDLHVGVERLLLDFFVEGLARDGGIERAPVEAAREWVEGRRRGKPEDCEGEETLREMERREGGRWRFAAEEEEEVGAEVGGLLLGALVEELVAELER